ncbi:MAG TPA: efflux RND transporter periplasmic adaptor subunit [Cyclobacteriaceae bacterium]|nr:efflux RND transporter periplasmic adaptor subunit [Cyclobacteriaceae bacterium]HRF32450.1 efflux RND transporter periplasmic adaptor subunit [Cyclobacteriaceae bacterium]
MKKNLKNSRQLWSAVRGLWTLAVIILMMTACSSDKQAENADTYICPMHPTVVSDRPSTCPVCGMDLVRKARAGEEVEITEDLARLIKSPNEVVIASIKTVKAEYKSLAATVQAQGVVTYDTRYVYNIPARIGGRLEKVYLKYAFQPVRMGQKVADIYSPELLTAQRELLYLTENDKSNVELIRSAKSKLLLLGASEKQVDEIMARKELVYTFSIFSGYDGYIISDNQQAPAMVTASSPAASSMGGGMGDAGMGSTPQTAAPSTPQPNAELIREGGYVTTGQPLFKVVNTSALRVELNLALAQAGSVKAGDKILLDLGNGKTEEAKVDFVQPFFSEGEEFIKVRVYVLNTELRIGQLVSATLQFQTSEALWLPKEAILDMGVEKIAFVKERGVFKPKKIITGIRSNGSIEVKQGLASSDEVASNAQYMVDSESFIKSK